MATAAIMAGSSGTDEEPAPAINHIPRLAELCRPLGDDHAGDLPDRQRLVDHFDLEPDVAGCGPDSRAQRSRRPALPGWGGLRFFPRTAGTRAGPAQPAGVAGRSHTL